MQAKKVTHRMERLIGDVMLDPLGIVLRDIRRHANRQQEGVHQDVPLTGFFRQFAPSIGEKNAAIRLRCNQTLSSQPLHCSRYRYVADPQPLRQVDRPRFALFLVERLDELDIILRLLPLMILAGPLEAVCAHLPSL